MRKTIILLLVMTMLFAGCAKLNGDEITNLSESPTTETLPMKVAVVIARDAYTREEFYPVMEALEAAGYEPIIVSDELGEALAKQGPETVQVQAAFEDISGNDLRGIVIIGGSISIWENTELHRLIVEVDKLDRTVAAICRNSVVLAKAKVIGLGDKACWLNCDEADAAMEEAGVTDSNTTVYVDGNIITGNGPLATDEFAAEIVISLGD